MHQFAQLFQRTPSRQRCRMDRIAGQQRQRPRTKNPPIRRYLHDNRKSLFVWDCVVGLGGLELPTKRLSVASFEQPPSIAGPRMAWASLASPACRRNGPNSASLRSCTHTRTESLGSGLCVRKRNFCGRDETAETVSLKFNWPFAENSFGHFAMHEIPTSGPLVNA